MTSARRQDSGKGAPGRVVTPLVVPKWAIPPARAGWIVRPRLLRLLDPAVESSVVLVAAPAGYGKTTLVSQWAVSGGAGTVAWVTLDPADNDPTRLWAHVAAALERAGCVMDANVAEFVAMSSTAILSEVVPRVAEALAAHPGAFTLVLDDCHVLHEPHCGEQLDQLVTLLPAQARLVVVSRSDPALRLGRLRVEGRLVEIRAGDLAFDAGEVDAVLRAAGVAVSQPELSALLERTEGWPAAVYLAALSLVGREDADALVRALSGSSRFIADYLSEEVLDRQGTELREFLLAMAVFDHFTVALATHVTATPTAARLLQRLERTNLFLIPLHDGWFRLHYLFAAYARSVLEVEHPETVIDLHRRGAQWFAAHNHTEEAIHHLLAAGDADVAAALVQTHWLHYFDAGRSATILDWLQQLHGTPAATAAPATVTAAWMAALTGDQAELSRRLADLETMTEDTPLPDGTRSPRSALMLIRGLFGYDGPDRMLADAREAVKLENTHGTPWASVAHAALGYAGCVAGDTVLARTHLGEAARAHDAPVTVQLLALATLASCEAEQGNHALSTRLADQAMDIVIEHRMHARPQAVFAFTAQGVALAASGQFEEAAAVLDKGLQARRRVPGLSPWPLFHHLLSTAMVAHHRGDRIRADQLLAEADALVPWDDDSTIGPSRARIAAVRHQLNDNSRRNTMVGEQLTPRELQILQRLRGDQTQREIARDLYVSPNTIKTITRSLYRKLGVHSRAEAINKAPAIVEQDPETPGSGR